MPDSSHLASAGLESASVSTRQVLTSRQFVEFRQFLQERVSSSAPSPQSDKLDSWKEISSFIGKDVRTAMRWAAQGMPVHRVPGAKRSRVFAFRSEIEAWLSGHTAWDSGPLLSAPFVEPPHAAVPTVPRRANPALWWWSAAAVIAAVLVVALVVRAHRPATAKLAKVVFRGDTVVALDATDRELWAQRYPGILDSPFGAIQAGLSDLVRVADLDGDGHQELIVVAAYRLGANPEDPFHVQVDCYSEGGQRLWSYVPDQKFQFGMHEVEGPWMVSDVFVSSHHPSPRIWVSVFQTQWGNSYVAELDPRSGKATLRFVNTGIIHRLNEGLLGEKRYLLVGAFNNEHDSGSLAVVDEAKAFVLSPQNKGTRHFCDSCPPGEAPDYYFVFPRSEINRVEAVYEDQVQEVGVSGAEIQATKWELHNKNGGTTIYRLKLDDPEAKPVSLRYDSTYDMLHRQFTAEGKLQHALEKCPERLHPEPVRIWTPAGGWGEITFPAAAD